jgi:small-conductance mechanosensitive channel
MLMVFQSVRQLGTAMIASAGVAGIVIGFAAQKSLGTLLAGFQIAMTQPIRIDDVVIVEAEWGKIEEITLTYVVVRIWDLRRLVVPITYFIEKPFQNWTRTSADILGTVFLQVDYGVPVDAVRQELTRILEASPNWDRKVNVLQVTDTKERTLELRALASSSDASKSWDLRCEMREKLVAFIQQKFPDSLPRLRTTIERAPRFQHPVAG